jgi:starch synthase
MDKKRVLIVTQEMKPYTAISEISEIARKLPQYIQGQGLDIRVLMPRFGTINERRHRLHEVVRLSGMNIIVDDDDYPLIIKVASIPGARMQVYFLDNEDFFKRKHVFEDSSGKFYDDNADRMVFFCKGVIETVKKFGWAPDIVHCHGWMTSLIPFYLKTTYSKEPLFKDSRVVYSVYNDDPGKNFGNDFFAKASINELNEADLKAFKPNGHIDLHVGAGDYSDALILNPEHMTETLVKQFSNGIDKPVLSDIFNPDEDLFLTEYFDFYQQLMTEDVIE